MKKSKTKKAEPNPDGSMSLSGHLRELRNRILVVVILLLAAFTACLSFSPDFITFLTDMGAKYNYVFVYIAPQELLLVYLNTALVGALVICFPVVAYEVYAFCSPGLTKRERTFFIGKGIGKEALVQPGAQLAVRPADKLTPLAAIGPEGNFILRDQQQGIVLCFQHDPLQRLRAVVRIIILLVVAERNDIAQLYIHFRKRAAAQE